MKMEAETAVVQPPGKHPEEKSGRGQGRESRGHSRGRARSRQQREEAGDGLSPEGEQPC